MPDHTPGFISDSVYSAMSRPGSAAEWPVHWVGSAKRDLLAMPAEVVDDFGYALGLIQLGGVRTAARDVALIRARLRAASQDYEARHATS